MWNESAQRPIVSVGIIAPGMISPNTARQFSSKSMASDGAVGYFTCSGCIETVQTLAEAQQPVPTNTEVVAEWTDLMKSANLGLVLQYRFVPQLSAPDSILLPRP